MTTQETKVDWARPGEPGYWEQQREQFAKNAKNSPANRALALVRRMALHPLEIAGPIGRIDLEDAREIAADADNFQDVTNMVPTPSPDLTALCREMLAYDNGGPNWSLPRELRDRLAAELEPVDGDLLLARKAVVEAMPDQGIAWGEAVLTGEMDGGNMVRIAQKAIGITRRALERGEANHG